MRGGGSCHRSDWPGALAGTIARSRASTEAKHSGRKIQASLHRAASCRLGLLLRQGLHRLLVQFQLLDLQPLLAGAIFLVHLASVSHDRASSVGWLPGSPCSAEFAGDAAATARDAPLALQKPLP